MDTADEQLDVVTRGVMALSVACARCHDHKFDPIPTADYYAMAGIFRSTDVLGGVKQGNNRTGYAGDFVYLSDPSHKQDPDEGKRKEVVALKRQLDAAQEDLQKARAELRQKVQAAGGDQPDKAKAKAKAKQAAKALAKREAARLREQQQKVDDLTAQIAACSTVAPRRGSGTPVMGVRDAKTEDCRINIRGEVADLGDSVAGIRAC
jgi:hypothetical protein